MMVMETLLSKCLLTFSNENMKKKNEHNTVSFHCRD